VSSEALEYAKSVSWDRVASMHVSLYETLLSSIA